LYLSPEREKNVIILHIGPHKTATTYIQQSLASSRKALEKSGWIYPILGSNNTAGHHDLAHKPELYLNKKSVYNQELVDLGKQGKNLIFSAEGFCRWPVKNFELFLNLFPKEKIKIVYTIREPASLLHSYWAETIKQGQPQTFPEFFAKHYESPFVSNIINPLVTLSPLKSLKRCELQIIPYDIAKADKLDLFELFKEQILKVELPPVKKLKKEVNKKFPMALSEFLRLLTHDVAEGKSNIGSDLRLKFISSITKEERQVIFKAMKRLAPISRKVIKATRSEYFYAELESRIKKELSSKFVVDIKKRSLFPEEPIALPYYESLSLLRDPEIRDLIAHYRKQYLDQNKGL